MSDNRFRAWYRSGPDRPLILAHRGDSSHAPENTLEAARVGLDSGADGWELDVRETADGALVAFHDESLLRTTDVARRFAGDPRAAAGYRVADFSLAEVRSLDAGSWFVDPEGGPRSAASFGTLAHLAEFDRALYSSGKVVVPTLAEALALTCRLDRLVNVEIKPGLADRRRAVESVLREVRESGTLALATISSFDAAVVAMAAAAEPAVATGLLVEGPGDPPLADLLRSTGADALHAPPPVVGPATRGLPVLAYTVNDAVPGGVADRLRGEGVVGLFTDDPAALAVHWGVIPSSRRTRSR